MLGDNRKEEFYNLGRGGGRGGGRELKHISEILDSKDNAVHYEVFTVTLFYGSHVLLQFVIQSFINNFM